MENGLKRGNPYNTKSFIEKARQVHGDAYIYSHVEYIRANQEVCIECPIHGVFRQQPASHLQGRGCPKCGVLRSNNKKAVSYEEFIQKVKHNNHCDLTVSKEDFGRFSSNEHVSVMCKTHNIGFKKCSQTLTRPNSFGTHCPEGMREIRKSKVFKDFCERGHDVHKGKYYYYDIVVSNPYGLVIICPEHGEFEQRGYHHVNGKGCPHCAWEESAIKRTLPFDEFVSRAKERHGDVYFYYNDHYIKSSSGIKVWCPVHGDFFTTVYGHLSSITGCTKCSRENHPGAYLESKVKRGDYDGNYATLYLIELENDETEERFYKIGVSARDNINERFKRFNEYKWKLLKYIKGPMSDIITVEHNIKESIEPYVPLIKFGGYTECFKSDKERDWIMDIMKEQT